MYVLDPREFSRLFAEPESTRGSRWLVVSAGAVSLAMLSACSSGSTSSAGHGGSASAVGGGRSSTASAPSSGQGVDGCTLVTAQELSQAVGVQYTAIQDAGVGSLCNVTGASVTESFYFHVDKESGPLNTWDGQVAIIKRDDGSEISVSGVGDRAVQGAVKEFAAEAKGYIVVVVNADVNNSATANSFTRTKTIEQFLISKL